MRFGPRLHGQRPRALLLATSVVLAGTVIGAVATSTGQAKSGLQSLQPRYIDAAAHDLSAPLRDLARQQRGRTAAPTRPGIHDPRIDRIPSIVTEPVTRPPVSGP